MKIDTGSAIARPPPPKASDDSGFAKHNITHLSASSINLWTNAPDVWVAKYLHGHRQQLGPAPRRGQLVETAAHMILTGRNRDDALKAVLDTFDRDFPGEDNARERDLIEPMTDLVVDELKPFGVPQSGGDDQRKISITANFGAWSIPVIGFLDFTYPDHGLVVDLKTTTRVPSVMSADHQLQRAIYAMAMGNQAVKFLYASAKKTAWLEDGDPPTVLARAKTQISRLNNFLLAHDANSALACVPCNPNSFYWRGDEAARNDLFGV